LKESGKIKSKKPEKGYDPKSKLNEKFYDLKSKDYKITEENIYKTCDPKSKIKN
jgi:hypothetical protein